MCELPSEDTHKMMHELFLALVTRRLSEYEVARELLKIPCPFPYVIIFNNPELTATMLELGCCIHSYENHSGKTALHFAVELMDVRNVTLLVQLKANVNAKDAYNRMPLHFFRLKPHHPDKKLEILKILIDNGALLNASSSKQQNHLYLNDPGSSVQSQLLSKGDIRTLRFLLPYIDLLEKDNNGKTPLHHLVKNNHPGVLEVLKGQSLMINARDSDGRTALDIAVFRLDAEKVQFLLETNASPNNLDRVGNPSLRYILINLPHSQATREIIKLLLIYDMDLQLLTKNCENSIVLGSAMDRDLEFSKLLLTHLAKLESCGEAMNEFVQEKIKGNEILEDYLDLCRRQIQMMKVTSVYEAVTLYKLLCESEKKLIMYVRSEEFQLCYECVKSNKYNICSYYTDSIKLRVDKAIAIAKIKDRAAHVVCQLVSLPECFFGTIAYKIVDYLHQKDLEVMSKFEASL